MTCMPWLLLNVMYHNLQNVIGQGRTSLPKDVLGRKNEDTLHVKHSIIRTLCIYSILCSANALSFRILYCFICKCLQASGPTMMAATPARGGARFLWIKTPGCSTCGPPRCTPGPRTPSKQLLLLTDARYRLFAFF